MKILIRILAIALTAVVIAGCADVQEVSAPEFQAMLARNPESMRHTEFVGVKDGKACLKVSTMSTLNPQKWTEEYFATDADQLPEEWLEKQKSKKDNQDRRMQPTRKLAPDS